MVRDRLNDEDVAGGFLLDGFPRNVGQAEVLRAIMSVKRTPLDAVSGTLGLTPMKLFCVSPGDEHVDRAARHITLSLKKPAVDGVCDKCQGELYQRGR